MAGFTDVSIFFLVDRLMVLLETSVDKGERRKGEKAVGRKRERPHGKERRQRRAVTEAEMYVMGDRAI